MGNTGVVESTDAYSNSSICEYKDNLFNLRVIIFTMRTINIYFVGLLRVVKETVYVPGT